MMKRGDSAVLAAMFGIVEKYGFVRFVLASVEVFRWWIEKSRESTVWEHQRAIDPHRNSLEEMIFRLEEIARGLQEVRR